MKLHSAIMIFRNDADNIIDDFMSTIDSIPKLVSATKLFLDNASVNKYHSKEVVYRWNAIDSDNTAFAAFCYCIRKNKSIQADVKVLVRNVIDGEYIEHFGGFTDGIADKHLMLFDKNYKNISLF